MPLSANHYKKRKRGNHHHHQHHHHHKEKFKGVTRNKIKEKDEDVISCDLNKSGDTDASIIIIDDDDDEDEEQPVSPVPKHMKSSSPKKSRDQDAMRLENLLEGLADRLENQQCCELCTRNLPHTKVNISTSSLAYCRFPLVVIHRLNDQDCLKKWYKKAKKHFDRKRKRKNDGKSRDPDGSEDDLSLFDDIVDFAESKPSTSKGPQFSGKEKKEKNHGSGEYKEARRLALEKYNDLQQFCIACGKDENLKVDHPLVEGRLCSTCLDHYQNVCFVCDEQDGKKVRCSICGDGGDLFVCDNADCENVFCEDCIAVYVSEEAVLKVKKKDSWRCYVCKMKPVNFIRPKEDGEYKLLALFQTSDIEEVDPTPVPNVKKPIRVLSLFDGLAAAKIVLDELDICVAAYYSSEIDPCAIIVSKANHKDSINYVGDVRDLDTQKLKEMGPFDLVIGGSPCNDFSTVNPKRKGMYEPSGTGVFFFEYHRILQIVLRLNSRQNRHTFWLFENVASMGPENRNIINRFFEHPPALYDSCYFTAQKRPRYFWGNIPGLYNVQIPETTENTPCLNDVLIKNCDRTATVTKVRCVTTSATSLKQGKQSLCPVMMNGKPDTLWPVELEALFGLPLHYTDVCGLNAGKRQKLIGQGWAIPVIKHILKPLRRFFKTKDDLYQASGQ